MIFDYNFSLNNPSGHLLCQLAFISKKASKKYGAIDQRGRAYSTVSSDSHEKTIASFPFLSNPYFKNAVKIYIDPFSQRLVISRDNIGKSGVYCWINLVTGNKYVGSSSNLKIRLSDYFKPSYLVKNRYPLAKSIIKHGWKNIALIIIEFTDKTKVVETEQKWLDLLKPEYNISKLASSPAGYNHSVETKIRIAAGRLGTKHLDKTRELMSRSHTFLSQTGRKVHSPETKAKLKEHFVKVKEKVVERLLKQSQEVSISVKVTDLKTNEITNYDSMETASKSLGISRSTLPLRRKRNSQRPLKGRYHIVYNLKDMD